MFLEVVLDALFQLGRDRDGAATLGLGIDEVHRAGSDTLRNQPLCLSPAAARGETDRCDHLHMRRSAMVPERVEHLGNVGLREERQLAFLELQRADLFQRGSFLPHPWAFLHYVGH